MAAQVLLGDRVGPSTVRKCRDQLAIGQHQNREQSNDRGADGERVSDGVTPGGGEHDDDRLRAVCDRGHRIERQRGESGGDSEPAPLEGVVGYDAPRRRSMVDTRPSRELQCRHIDVRTRVTPVSEGS